jgi:predicted Zn-ribbon and HTH transcriptional regulator
MRKRRSNVGKPVSSKLHVDTRKCLGCGKEFISAWVGNRRCPKCRKVISNANGVLGEDMIQVSLPRTGRFG